MSVSKERETQCSELYSNYCIIFLNVYSVVYVVVQSIIPGLGSYETYSLDNERANLPE